MFPPHLVVVTVEKVVYGREHLALDKVPSADDHIVTSGRRFRCIHTGRKLWSPCHTEPTLAESPAPVMHSLDLPVLFGNNAPHKPADIALCHGNELCAIGSLSFALQLGRQCEWWSLQ